jgi:hypothetical protein
VSRRAPRPDQLASLAAIVLLLLGVLGFVPGATAHLGDIRFAGQGSHAELFGTFRVSVLLNLVHLGLGAALVAVAGSAGPARALLAGGIASLSLWAVGALAAGRFVPLPPADNWLHFGLGIALLGAGAL